MKTLAFKAGQSAAGGLGAEWEVCQTMQRNMSALEPTVMVERDLSIRRMESGGDAGVVPDPARVQLAGRGQ